MLKHTINKVVQGSAAWRSGIRKGDKLCSINNETIQDQIDYQALSYGSKIDIVIEKPDNSTHHLPIIKAEGEALGLSFDKSMDLNIKFCANKCIFCFVDQMPKGLRKTLYVKDDDWRYSLMMGNYVTLTNVGETEFERILKRKPSPLYISVHATDGDVRNMMLGNPTANKIMDRLKKLAKNGIQFHTQIVLCPGINDGEILKKSLEDLITFIPNILSVAIVPVGLTKFRKGLYPLRTFTTFEANDIIDLIATFQESCLKNFNTRLIYMADEWFVLSKRPIPNEEYYENYPQIENGVGMLRLLESQVKAIATLEDTLNTNKKTEVSKNLKPKNILIATGVAASHFLDKTIEKYKPINMKHKVHEIINYTFGETVTVAALITGKDLIEQINKLDLSQYDELWITETMLRVNEKLFLDDISLEEARNKITLPIKTIGLGGDSLYDAMWQN
ncbi:MAG: DUF512 domain-containing protein [Christensenellaceae bacterium]|nr:DUF512 domain-containing protein [Christensenellaceae bacterium]